MPERPTYRCRVDADYELTGPGHSVCTVSKMMDLPMAPFIGLELEIDADNYGTVAIKHVEIDADGVIIVWTDNRTMNDRDTFVATARRYRALGWTVNLDFCAGPDADCEEVLRRIEAATDLTDG